MTTSSDVKRDRRGLNNKNGVPNAVKFTPMTAKEAQEASVRARNLRKQMRAQLLDAAINEGIDKLFIKAMKSGDADMMGCVEKAIKIIGLSHDQSEEAVQKLDITSENKTELSGEIKFVLPPKQ